VTKLFAGSSDVEFMDVNLKEESIHEGPNGEPYSPGAGGWPTVRYFNKETGIAGAPYKQKTSEKVCDELGKEDNMVAYVEEYGNTALCTVETGKGCNEKELKYIKKVQEEKTLPLIKKELRRLDSMADSSMTPALATWLKQRKKILKQMIAAGEPAEEGSEDEL